MKKTVLSIDDEPDVLRCIQSVLDRAGYRSVTSDAPDKAMDTIHEQKADMLTLDIRMPNISGFEVYEALKAKYGAAIPVLFVTAYPTSFSVDSDAMVKMWQEDFADGNTDILYKPFDIDTLVEKVEALIGPPEVPDSDA